MQARERRYGEGWWRPGGGKKSDKSISRVWCGNLEVQFTVELTEEQGGVRRGFKKSRTWMQ